MQAERTEVVVALIRDATGRILVSRRRPGRHMAGYWEFPGGKRAAGEKRLQALQRELHEELGIRLLRAEPFMRLDHDYPDSPVALDVWLVSTYAGQPRSLEGQQLDWVEPGALARIELLPADRPIVARLVATSSGTLESGYPG